jgi:hypothetical protein
LRAKITIKTNTVKLGDWLFVNGVASPVLSISEPCEVLKFPARIAYTNRGEITLFDGDSCEVLQYVIEGLVYADKHSHDAAQASQSRAFKLQLQHQNSNYI